MNIAKQQIKIREIFEEHWEEFWKRYKEKFPQELQEAIEEAIEKMLGCGDISKGYYHYKCTSCGQGETIVGYSCKSRFCARCGKLYTDEWLEKTAEKIANVEHRHLVFTIPDEFRKLIYWNRKLLKKLADMAVETIETELARHQERRGSKSKLMPGIILVIHTFGRDMRFNPHIHILLANVAIDKQTGEKRKLKFLLYRTLHKVWQYKFLKFMAEYFQEEMQVQESINMCWQKYPNGFYVNVQRPMKDADHAIFYIGRYLGRPAIAEYRIAQYDGEYVKFWYEDHQSGQREYATLPVYQFMARLVQHIPLKNFQIVRRYGFYARNVSEKIRDILATLKKGVQKVFDFFTGKKKWRERIINSFGKDPLKCPHCGTEMELWQIWHPKYGIIYDFIRDNTEKVVELSHEPEKQKQTDGIDQLLMPFMQAERVYC